MIKKVIGLTALFFSLIITSEFNNDVPVEAASQCHGKNEITNKKNSTSGEEYYEVSIETANCLQSEKSKSSTNNKSFQTKEVIESDDTLIEVFQSESTGIRGEVRALNAEDAKIIRKEEGIPNKVIKVKIIKDKDIASKVQKHPGNKNLEKNSIQSLLVNPLGTDTSGWDLVGTEYWSIRMSWFTDTVWHSHGGDYSVVIPPHYSNSNAFGKVRLYDSDTNFNTDEFIGEKTFYPSSTVSKRYVWSGLDSFKDGADNLVETYTMHYTNYVIGSGRVNNVKYYD